MAYKQIQGRSEFPKTGRGITSKLAGPAPTTNGSSYNNFIDSTASYLKGEQGLIPDSLTGGKPTKQAIGDGIRKVANSIDPSKKLKKSTKKAQAVSKGPKPTPQPSKSMRGLEPSKPSKPSPKPSKSGPKPKPRQMTAKEFAEKRANEYRAMSAEKLLQQQGKIK
tara:strand:+ start:80 stop:574 length:495 start_codon:yes stop_codon:yes gene_type:complete